MEVTICITVFFFFQLSSKQDTKLSKPETHVKGGTNQTQTKSVLTQDNVKIKGLQANVSIPKVIVYFRAFCRCNQIFLMQIYPKLIFSICRLAAFLYFKQALAAMHIPYQTCFFATVASNGFILMANLPLNSLVFHV